MILDYLEQLQKAREGITPRELKINKKTKWLIKKRFAQ